MIDTSVAKELFESIFEKRKLLGSPFQAEHEKTLRAHSNSTAKIAQAIASKTSYLNSEKAYIFGLLHDYGRFVDEWKDGGFHGVVGYKELLKDHPEIAKICLTHSFYDSNFDLDENLLPRERLLEAKELLKDIKYDDYDRLIHLCDLLNMHGRFCTIDERYDELVSRYNVPRSKMENRISKAKEIKEYFDKICNENIYRIIGIKI